MTEAKLRRALSGAVVWVSLADWADAQPNPFHDRCMASELPHGPDCPCLMCADERRARGLAMHETELGSLARRRRARADGIEHVAGGG